MKNNNKFFFLATLALEFPVGANAILYIIVGEKNGNIQLLFQNIDSGLVINNIDNDKDLELISTLNGYFYDIEGEDVYLYNTILSKDISQVVWDEQEHNPHIYYTDKSQTSGIIDTFNLKILLKSYIN